MKINKYAKSLMSTLQFIKEHSPVSRNDMIKVLLDTRQLLESEELKQKYSLINLFLNWCFHPNISQSKIAFNLLYELSLQCSLALDKKQSEEDDKEATRIFIGVAENALNIPLLRQEYIQLFREYRLPKFLFNIKVNWDSFIKVILEEICEKPLTFPEDVLGASRIDDVSKQHKGAFKTMQKIRQINPSKPWTSIIDIRITKDNEGFKNLYCIQISTMAKLKYVMQLKGNEPEGAFETH